MLAVVEVQTTQVCMKLKGEAGVDCLPDNHSNTAVWVHSAMSW